jgi:hypothetical protein
MGRPLEFDASRPDRPSQKLSGFLFLVQQQLTNLKLASSAL